ncbi:DUF6082 family protein [Nonomuraea glycinis]|uniref:DUF6082 family protein n=1 Tax=Nonomuraea glycinis TaxID=2047744 RepID=UPI0033B2A404
MVVATALSPLLLEFWVDPTGSRWQDLSDIGETYGVASAILSAFALMAIGSSLFLQAREARFTRREAERMQHFQLLQLQIEQPVLHRSFGAFGTALDPRVHLYLNLVLSYWEMLYEVGELPEDALVEYARVDFFDTDPGRRFWDQTREHRHTVAKTRSAVRFVAAIDRAYALSLMEEPVQDVTAAHPASRRTAMFTTAMIAAALLGWLLGSKRPRKSCR